MKATQWLSGLTMTVLVAACAAPHPAPAQEHPPYLHAMSDLRLARAILDRPQEWNVMHDQAVAMQEIDRALGEIARASMDDHKNPHDPEPIDAHLDHRGRLKKVMELLDSADHDLRAVENNPAAVGWRDSAIQHVDEARGAVHRAFEDKRLDQFRE
jgi:hypothetical protein